MKRIPVLFTLFFFLCPFVHAAELEPAGSPLRKLQRGFLNIALSPIEIVHELDRQKNVDSLVPSWFTGVGMGSAYMAGRIAAGAYEMVTFPVPLPSGYQPLVEPEFEWQHLDNQTGYQTPVKKH
ncbi:MAG TPA: exosortase system-associated protein, TIGR04073 family [Verrucomicrobiae bacterium]|jgi:putative exosortase-associated protein (TIGR04073 family)|nr:exosortase system-associated protein, TIGR04073 family [Verrucomicrobiae bacterium]